MKKEKKKSKKILCSLALCGMTLLSTISVAYAAPSISKNGTIDNSSILVNGEKTELVAKFSNDSSIYKEIGVPDNVINDIDKINRLTIKDYRCLMKGAQKKKIDESEQLFLLAWVIRQAKAQKKSGRYVYRTFKQFFNRKKIESSIENQNNETSLIERIRQAVEIQGRK